MVVSLKLCDEELMSLGGFFSGAHTFPTMFHETGSGCSGPRISTEDTIESMVGIILTLSTRAVKRYHIGYTPVVPWRESVCPFKIGIFIHAHIRMRGF